MNCATVDVYVIQFDRETKFKIYHHLKKKYENVNIYLEPPSLKVRYSINDTYEIKHEGKRLFVYKISEYRHTFLGITIPMKLTRTITIIEPKSYYYFFKNYDIENIELPLKDNKV